MPLFMYTWHFFLVIFLLHSSFSQRVERASEFAVSEVFSLKKPHNGKKIMPLQNVEQLQDHDDAYSEGSLDLIKIQHFFKSYNHIDDSLFSYSTAQSILSEWMNQKLRLELEMDDDDEEEDEISSSKIEDSESKQLVKSTESSYNNFDGTNRQITHFLGSLP